MWHITIFCHSISFSQYDTRIINVSFFVNWLYCGTFLCHLSLYHCCIIVYILVHVLYTRYDKNISFIGGKMQLFCIRLFSQTSTKELTIPNENTWKDVEEEGNIIIWLRVPQYKVLLYVTVFWSWCSVEIMDWQPSGLSFLLVRRVVPSMFGILN